MSMAMVISTVRNPALSLWQSCLHRVLSRKAGVHGEAGGLDATVAHPAMEDASAAAREHAGSHEVEHPPSRRERASVCARLLSQLVLARALGRHEEAQRLESEVRFASCDPLWVASVVEYERALLLRGTPFYRRHESLEDFILPELPDEATVALLADWGTGMPDAQALLEQISSFQPHAIIHLGDIYYSGTPHEVRAHFLHVFARVFGSRWPRVLTLAGNHDRYSGGQGYRELLEALGQPSSYFCLRNRSWQLLAMDTGYHDLNPRALADTLTRLEDSEMDWLLDKVRRAGGRGTVLLSHHPFFSLAGVGHDAEGRRLALNSKLASGLVPILGEVAAWFWGHEHNLHLYEPYAGLARGRCIGAGAVPVLSHEQRNTPLPGLVPAFGESGPPRRLPGIRLGNDGLMDYHAYAILTLRGPRLTVRYYQMENRLLVPGQVPAPGPPLHEETVSLSSPGTP